MTKRLKMSEFLGLATMLTVGLYQWHLPGRVDHSQWMVGGHGHHGVLSALAVGMGVAVPGRGLMDTMWPAVTVLFIAG